MGKVMIIMVVLVTVIFATLSLTMRQSTDEFVDSMNENLDDMRAKKYLIMY